MAVRPLLTLAVAVVGLVIPGCAAADDGHDRAEVRTRGVCTGSSVSTLRVRSEEGTVRIEFQIDSPRDAARTWTLVVLRERRIAFRGMLRPARGSRSVRLRRTVPDWPGSEQIVVRAVTVNGETCRAQASPDTAAPTLTMQSDTLLRQRPVRAKPLIDFCERCGAKTVDPPLRLLPGIDQPCFPQHSQVAGDARPSDRQQRRQLTRGRRAAGQRLQQRPPALVGDRAQNSFHGTNVPMWLRNCQGT